jgi:hypothetical protein
MRSKIKELETDCVGLIVILCAIFLILGIFIGMGISDHGQRRVEKAQQEIRLDLNKIEQKKELAQIINGLFQERKEIIDWNRNNIILTVEPKTETEGN